MIKICAAYKRPFRFKDTNGVKVKEYEKISCKQQAQDIWRGYSVFRHDTLKQKLLLEIRDIV